MFPLSTKLLSNETKNISFEVPIEANFPSGDYQLQYFVFSPSGFNYSGRNFIEEDVAGVTNFTVNGANNDLVYFDPNSIKVNGTAHKIREQLNKFSPGGVQLEVKLNNTGENVGIPVKYYFYR